MAIVFGITSPKTTISAVMIAVAAHTPRSPKTPSRTLVAIADEPMVTSCPPSSMALMSRPRAPMRRVTNFARLVARGFERMHAGARGRRQGGLGAGEERGGGDAQDDDDNVEGVRHRMVLARRAFGRNALRRVQLEGASSRARKAETLAFLDIAGDEALADASDEDEGQFAALDLLVLTHCSQETSRIRLKAGNVAYAGRKADGLQVRLDTRGVLPGAQTQVTRETKRQRHADGDALAMHEPSRIIVGQLLQGVAKSVPEG